ncbi:hypothetical protein [Rhodococcus globerulus]|uniref:hypothetical protein n=1 Tax=Rhodococcus globerulus TaxID=33008 RepID=UPI003015B99E
MPTRVFPTPSIRSTAGYLAGTNGGDGDGIDVFVGTDTGAAPGPASRPSPLDIAFRRDTKVQITRSIAAWQLCSRRRDHPRVCIIGERTRRRHDLLWG